MVHLCSDRFAWRINIVQKYMENLCEFMQINLDVDTTGKEILFYVV